MLKKLLLSALCLSVLALVSNINAAQAQAPALPELTAADIELFLKISAAPPAEQGQLLVDSGAAAEHYAGVQAKAMMWAGIESQPFDDATKKTMLTSNPQVSFTDAELALLKARSAELLASYAALTGAAPQ